MNGLANTEKSNLVVGITGSLATGKSTVSAMLSEMGCRLLDADRIAHDLLDSNSRIKNAVKEAFGSRVASAEGISRKALRQEVFTDPKKLSLLENILHPAIIEKIERAIGAAEREVLIIDAPLLLETRLSEMVDIVVVVKASMDTQLERAKARGMDVPLAERIIKAQMPLREKERLADAVIDNDGDINRTKEQVEELWQKELRKQRANWT